MQCSVLLDAALRCLMAIKNVGRAIEHFYPSHLTPKYRICDVCTASMGHSAGAHETLEMLDEMLDSFDHPDQSSTKHGRLKASKVVRCSVKCWIPLTRT